MDWGEKVTGKYKVKSGDNLTSISSVLGIPTDSLQAFNNIKNPDKIQVGQELLWRRDPSIIESALRWAFESDEDTQKSRDINNKIQSNINRVVPIIDPEYESLKRTIFKNKDIKNFSNVMSKIYTKVLTDLSLPLHNVPNLVRQDALESSYGTSTRGNGYNLGGVKVFIDKEKLGTKYKDGFYYRNFNDLEDYARYKVNLLENDYGGIISSPASEFIDRLHGNNPGKKNYSANKKHYINSFKGMKTLDSYLNELKQGGRFTFKKNKLVKNAEASNKRDMRKKLVKSDIPNSTKNKAKKYQAGGELVDLPNIIGIRNRSWNTGVLGSGIMSAEDGIKVPEIKIDPSIFTSWNSIHSDLVIPDIEYFTPVDTSFTDNLSKNIILQDNKKEEKSTKKEVKKEKSKEQPKIVDSHYIYNNKDKWASDLIESYKRAGITNQEALRYLLAQDALESAWGKSAQGKYNYGNLTTGSNWSGNYVQGKDKDAAGNPISQKFRSYNNMDEYTRDKINFLTRLYDFNQNDTADVFISKLLGNNSGKRRYAEARNYGEVLKNVYNSVSKYQHGGTLIFGNPETSEMLTYRMEDGSLKTIPNPGAGFVSGTDPVGQVVVEGAILNKPLGWALGKAINWAKGLAKRSKIRSGNVNTETTSINNTSEPIIRKEDLPEYANPNWKGDAVELTKDRLRNGGFERLENNYEGSYKYSEDHKNNILKSIPASLKSSDFSYMGVTPENVGIAVRGSSSNNLPIWGVFQDASELYKIGQPFFDLSSHEFSHWIRHFTPKIDKSIYESVVKEAENSKLFKYLSDPEEWLARGTQIKNYFGLKEGEELTGDMLRYAAQNMVKDRGYDNNLTMFFKGIKDFDKMAKILSKYALGTTAIVKGVNEYKRNDKQ